MNKLSLTNLAKDQVKQEEAQKIKGGICYCTCSCSCPPDYRIDLRLEEKLFERDAIA